MPDGSTYPYSVAGDGGIGVDVVKEFATACSNAGLGWGFYYRYDKKNGFMCVRMCDGDTPLVLMSVIQRCLQLLPER
jgi:hypothetical protein